MRAFLLLLLLAAASTPAHADAQRVTAEQALEASRRAVMGRTASEAGSGCDPAANPDEIVVCGRNDTRDQRVAPSDPVAGAPDRLGPGDLPGGAAAMSADSCIRLCHQPVQVDVIGAARGIGRAIGRLLDPDD